MILNSPKTAVFLTVAFLNIFSPSLTAAEDLEHAITRISGKIKIDGALNEPEWSSDSRAIRLTQVEPHPGKPPTEATKVWLTANKDSLYIAVRCEDSNPGQIVATEMRRDAFLMDNDNIEIILDTYHDHRNGYFFSTNPAGALAGKCAGSI